MIYEVEGDIMLTRAQVIAHNVAVADPMTRGLARKLRELYPAMTEQFLAWCEETGAEPGQVWFWGRPGRIQVANLITHEADDDPARPRRPDKIALSQSLRALKTLYTEHRFKSVAMPTIGAGEFGLDWIEVRDMLHAQLGELLIPVFVYVKELEGQVAHEPGM